MPEPIESPQITKRDRKKWRAHFEDVGREAIRHKVNLGTIGPDRVREVAVEWLREKEIEQERRERQMLGYAKWAWDAAFAAAVLTAIGIGVALWLGFGN